MEVLEVTGILEIGDKVLIVHLLVLFDRLPNLFLQQLHQFSFVVLILQKVLLPPTVEG